jgi:hypothetical protein
MINQLADELTANINIIDGQLHSVISQLPPLKPDAFNESATSAEASENEERNKAMILANLCYQVWSCKVLPRVELAEGRGSTSLDDLAIPL